MKNIEETVIQNVENIQKGQGFIQKYCITTSDNVPQCEKLINAQKAFKKVNGSGKTIIIGDSFVGKTSLFYRGIFGTFEEKYRPTVGLDFYNKPYKIQSIPFTLSIWDTAGQERYRSITKTYYRGTNCCLLLFDLTKNETLENIQEWIQEALEASEEGGDWKVFLVGTKCDLTEKREVDKNKAIRIAETIKAEYWEVSSKTGENVKELFIRIAYLVWGQLLLEWEDELDKNDQEITLKLNQPDSSMCSC